MRADALLFFSGHEDMLPLYERLEETILTFCPDAQIQVQKSQIAFSNGYRFAFASVRGKRFVVTFGLPERVESQRIWQSVEPYPGRWTHHVVVRSQADIDRELAAWLRQACQFAGRK